MSVPAAITDIVRRRHVHYDVAAPGGNGSASQDGVMLRLWAVHEKGAGVLPGCEKCGPLLDDLRRVVEFVFRSSDVALVDTFFRPALYDSAVVPGADEIALEVRLSSGNAAAPSESGSRQALRRLRALLQALGVSER